MTKRHAFENFDDGLIAEPITDPADVRLNKLLNFYNTIDVRNKADLARDWVVEYMTAVQFYDCSVDVLRKVEAWRITNSVVTLCRLWLLDARFGPEIIHMHHGRIAAIIEDYRKRNPEAPPVEAAPQSSLNPGTLVEGLVIEIERNLETFASNGYVGRFPSTYDFLYMRKVCKQHALVVMEKFRPLADEISLLAKGNCPKDLKEAYSSLKPEAISNLVKAVRSIVDEAERYVAGRSVTRKPRKKKVKTPAELVSGMTYQKNFEPLALVSIRPEDIIGAQNLYLYNTKYKKVTRLTSEHSKGLTVKGSTVEGFSKHSSKTKVVPDPHRFFQEFHGTGNPAIHKNMVDTLETKSNEANGRVGKDTIILGVSK